jgi:hypothetical protein
MQNNIKALFIEYIKNPTQRISELPKKLWGQPLNELLNITVKTITPSITRAVRQAQIELHIQSWKAGFNSRDWEIIVSEGQSPFNPPKIKDPSFIDGYTHRQTHGPIPFNQTLRKKIIEQGLRKWSDLAGEKVVSTLIKNSLLNFNPLFILRKIISTIAKYGLPRALPLVFVELIYQSFPYWGFHYLGKPLTLLLSQIPLPDILTPKYLAWLKIPSELQPSHLEWYESEFGLQKLARKKSPAPPKNYPHPKTLTSKNSPLKISR